MRDNKQKKNKKTENAEEIKKENSEITEDAVDSQVNEKTEENTENKKSDNISAAEKRREQRKAKEVKAVEKSSSKDKKPVKISDKVFGITVLVVLVVFLAVFLLNFFGVPRKTLTAVKLGDNYKISVAEYEFYYRAVYDQFYNQSAQYESYGPGYGKMYTGYDSTKTPSEQSYTLGDLEAKYGKNPTWADFFESYSIKQAKEINIFYDEAVKDGYKLSKSEQKDINSFIKSLSKSATDNNCSLDAYIRLQYGKGMSEKLLIQVATKQLIASDFVKDKSNAFKKSITEKEILNTYNSNKDDYNISTIRYFAIASEAPKLSDDATAKEKKAAYEQKVNEAKAKADDMLAAIKNEDSFVSLAKQYAPADEKTNYADGLATLLSDKTKSDIKSSVASDVADWAYDDSRAVSDKNVIKVSNSDGSATFFVVYMVTLPHKDTILQPTTVRHILIKTTDADGKALTGAAKEQKKAKAEEILATWNNGKKTSDSFAKLAEKYSEDSGSSSDGGLIKDVSRSSNFVPQFINWSIEDGRKAGDTGIIESSYGYHIMYCVSTSKTTEWESTIKTTLANNKFSDYQKKLFDSKKYKLTYNESLLKNVKNRTETYAAQQIANK